MRKTAIKASLTLSFFFLITQLRAQDKLITSNGDTIECDISKVSSRFIHFSYTQNGVEKASAMNINLVRSFIQDGVSTRIDSAFLEKQNTIGVEEEQTVKDNSNQKHPYFKPTRVHISGGYAKFNGGETRFPSRFYKEHYEDLISGFYISTGIAGFFSNKSLGMGVRIHYLNNSASTRWIEFRNNQNFKYSLNNAQNTFFIGPNFLVRSSLNGKGNILILGGLSVGPVLFAESGSSSIIGGTLNYEENYTDEIITAAAIMELNLEIGLTEKIMLTFGGTYFLNHIDSIDLFKKEDGVRININHFTLGVGGAFVF